MRQDCRYTCTATGLECLQLLSGATAQEAEVAASVSGQLPSDDDWAAQLTPGMAGDILTGVYCACC